MAAMPPDTANADSLARVGDTVATAVIASLSRTAIIARPDPVRRRWLTTTTVTTRKPRQR